MTIEFKKKVVKFFDVVSVDEAESLLEWLQNTPGAKLDLAACIPPALSESPGANGCKAQGSSLA